MIHRNHSDVWVPHDIVRTHSATHKCKNESQPVGIRRAALTECATLYILYALYVSIVYVTAEASHWFSVQTVLYSHVIFFCIKSSL